MFNPAIFKPNPGYGKGVFRRRIRLVRHATNGDTGSVHGALEDCNHGFQCAITYADGQITTVTPNFMRIPFTTCDGAGSPLSRLVGAAITATPAELLAIAPPLANCTHLHDLTLLAIAHTQRPEAVVQFDIEVTDAQDGLSDLRVWRSADDSERVLMHHWQSVNHQLVFPTELKDKPLFMGFSRWANATFSGLANEAAFVLQKGNLVSVGRLFDVDAMAGSRAVDENSSVSCFTYSPPNNAVATRRANTVRDFSDCEEQLLRFV